MTEAHHRDRGPNGQGGSSSRHSPGKNEFGLQVGLADLASRRAEWIETRATSWKIKLYGSAR